MTAFGIRKDAKVKTFTHLTDPDEAYNDWQKWIRDEWEAAKKLGHFDNAGDALAARGWDGYEVPLPDGDVLDQNYWVILNRRAMVAVDGDPF